MYPGLGSNSWSFYIPNAVVIGITLSNWEVTFVFFLVNIQQKSLRVRLFLFQTNEQLQPNTSWIKLLKQDLDDDKNRRGKYHQVPTLDTELQAANDYRERGNSFLLGMRPPVGYKVTSPEITYTQTTPMGSAIPFMCVYVTMIKKIWLLVWDDTYIYMHQAAISWSRVMTTCWLMLWDPFRSNTTQTPGQCRWRPFSVIKLQLVLMNQAPRTDSSAEPRRCAGISQSIWVCKPQTSVPSYCYSFPLIRV